VDQVGNAWQGYHLLHGHLHRDLTLYLWNNSGSPGSHPLALKGVQLRGNAGSELGLQTLSLDRHPRHHP
jgi:hypothetical protein